MKPLTDITETERRAHADALFVLLFVTLLLAGAFFTVMLYCSGDTLLRAGLESPEALRQLYRRVIFTLGALGVFWICSCLPLRFYRRAAGFLLAAAVVLAGFGAVFGTENSSGGMLLSLGSVSLRPA